MSLMAKTVRRFHEFLKHGEFRYSANLGLDKTHCIGV